MANPWFIVAAVAFSASNRPEGVPEVFRYVLQELPPASELADRRMIAGKLREAIFKSGLISGYPKVRDHEWNEDAINPNVCMGRQLTV